MNTVKRIFSVLLAVMLAFSAIPFMSIEAEALNLEEGGNKIEFRAGYGAIGGIIESNKLDDGAKVKLPSATACGFSKTNSTLVGWMINGEYYEVGDEFVFDEDDAYKDGADMIIRAEAVWEDKSSGSTSSDEDKGKYITVTFDPGVDEDENKFREFKSVKTKYKDEVDGKKGYYVVTFPECPFTPKGYKFLGWRIAGISGEYVQPGDSFGANENFSAVAMWEKIDEGVTVNKVGDIKSIAIKTKPKTSYKIGETFSSSGLVITATKGDGSTQDITSGFTVSLADGTKFEKSGEQTVTVTYKSLTATFTVTVKSNSSSSASSSKPASSSSSSSVPESSSSSSSSESSSETSSESSSVPEVEEPEVFEPISLAYSISGDIPVTGIEFLLGEDIGENPQLRVMAIDANSATDAATSAFIANGDALAAFDLSLLVDGLAYHGNSLGTVNYALNGTQANAECRFDSYVLAMVHVTNIGDYDGDYYMTDGENTYLYTPETDFKTAVANVALVEEDGVYRIAIRDITGLSSFAYQAANNVIVEVNLLPSASASSASIDVASLSPVLLVQLEVGEGSGSGFAIPFWVWIIIGVIVLLVIVLIVLYLINRQNEQKRYEESRRRPAYSSTTSTITGFDDEE